MIMAFSGLAAKNPDLFFSLMGAAVPFSQRQGHNFIRESDDYYSKGRMWRLFHQAYEQFPLVVYGKRHSSYACIMKSETLSATQQTRYLTAQWVLPVAGEPVEAGFVAIQGQRISAIGRYADLPKGLKIPPPKPGSLITPGLINVHTHLEQSFPEPLPKAPDQNFVEWLLSVIALTRSQNQPEARLARCMAGVGEVLRTGTTFVNDIASGPESIQALAQAGLRGLISLEVFHPGYEDIRIQYWVEAYQGLEKAVADHPLLRVGLSPHSPYNVSPPAWQVLCKELNPALVHTHLGEFDDETAYLAGRPSQIIKLHQQVLGKTYRPELPARSPVQALMRKRLLEMPTVIAHAIHTTKADREEMASLPVGIAHCPRSNLGLHGKTLHWADWRNTGIPVGLGTDGRLSTPDLDLRAEARCAMSQHGWDATEALQALTLNGARALGLSAEIGSLEPGKKADLVIWQAPVFKSGISPEAMALHQATHIGEVIIDGQTRYEAERQ